MQLFGFRLRLIIPCWLLLGVLSMGASARAQAELSITAVKQKVVTPTVLATTCSSGILAELLEVNSSAEELLDENIDGDAPHNCLPVFAPQSLRRLTRAVSTGEALCVHSLRIHLLYCVLLI